MGTEWKKSCCWVAVVSALMSCQALWAWSAQGHKALTRQAMLELNPAEQAYYVTLSRQLSWSSLKKRPHAKMLDKRVFALHANDSFIELSVLADEYRDLSLAQLFKRFHEKVPTALRSYADKNTSNWHYHNALADPALAKRCNFSNRGKLLEASLALDKALDTPLTPKQEALVLALQVHLIEDLHQPLHTFTRLDENCRSDRGGNNTCYQRKPLDNSCARNLHAQWDSGFGIFAGALPKTGRIPSAKLDFDPQLWAAELLPQYSDVYGLDDPDYEQRGAKIVARNADLNRARLRHYLAAHYRKKNTHE